MKPHRLQITHVHVGDAHSTLKKLATPVWSWASRRQNVLLLQTWHFMDAPSNAGSSTVSGSDFPNNPIG
jgi:hypothetical protein